MAKQTTLDDTAIIGKVTSATVPKIFKKQREMSKRGLSAQYENTESCWAFYNNDQMSSQDNIQFQDSFGRKRRAMVNFNKVQQNVDSVVGFMAQNRRQAKFIAHLPKDQGQQVYSKNMNAIYDYHREFTNSDQLETEQDLDMMVNGYGAIDTELSYQVGNAAMMPNGNILKKLLNTSCFYWDTRSKGKNLLDARWMGYWEDHELRDAINLFQGSEAEDFEQVSETDSTDTGYVFNPYGGIYDKVKMLDNVEWASKEAEMVRVYNHQWMEYETFYKAANPIYTATDPLDATFMKMKMDGIKNAIKLLGDTKEEDMFAFDPTAEELVFDQATKQALVKAFGKMIDPIPFTRKVFYTAVISGEHVFTWFKSVSQTGFSIKVKTGNWNRNRKVWMGMVNSMMEPQKYYNKALTELMFTIAANSKGGVMVEEGAVEDIADFEGKWAKTDAVIKVAAGAISGQKIMQKTQGAVPTGLENILQLADANIAANGVDPSFLGQTDNDDQSGIFYKRRIRQVAAKFARYFDSGTLYQKEDARLHEDLIRVWVQNNQGEWMRITGPDGADDFIRILEDMLAPAYDISIQEASQSSDEKQETATMLGTMATQLLAGQDLTTAKALMSESLDFIQIDGDVRQRLKQALQPQQPQVDPQQFQMLQQQMQQMQDFIKSGEMEKIKSETLKNNATAAKTMKDADLSAANLPKVHAETVKILEDAHHLARTPVQQPQRSNA